MFSASLWIIIDYELTNAVHSAAQTPEGMISGGVKCRKYIPPLSIYLKSSFFFQVYISVDYSTKAAIYLHILV